MNKGMLIALLIAACDKRPIVSEQWHGIPQGVQVRCKFRGGVGVCVGSGLAFQCVDVGMVGDDKHRWREYQCAQITAPILPERQKEAQ